MNRNSPALPTLITIYSLMLAGKLWFIVVAGKQSRVPKGATSHDNFTAIWRPFTTFLTRQDANIILPKFKKTFWKY